MIFLKNITVSRHKVIVIVLLFLLVAQVQGASANFTISSDKFLVDENGTRMFVFGMHQVCSDVHDYVYETCQESINKMTNFSFSAEQFNANNSYRDLNSPKLATAGIYYETLSSVVDSRALEPYFMSYLQIPNEPSSDAEYDTLYSRYNTIKSNDPNHPIRLQTWTYHPSGSTYDAGDVADIVMDVTYAYTTDCQFSDRFQEITNCALPGYWLDDFLFAKERYLWSNMLLQAGFTKIEQLPDPLWSIFEGNGMYWEVGGDSYRWPVVPEHLVRAQTYWAYVVGYTGVSFWGYKFYTNDTTSFGIVRNETIAAYYDALAGEVTSSEMQNAMTTPTINYSWDNYSTWDSKVTFSSNPKKSAWGRYGYSLTYRLNYNSTSEKYYLFISNKNNISINNVDITVDGLGNKNITTLGKVGKGSNAPGRTLTMTDDVFTDTFDAYAGHVYEISNESGSGDSDATMWTISGTGSDDAFWSDYTLDNAVIRGNRHVTNDLAVQGYLSWWDGLTNNTGSTVVWDVNRTTANDGVLNSTSIWNVSGGWEFNDNNDNLVVSSDVINRNTASVFLRFVETTGKTTYGKFYSANDSLHQFYRRDSDTLLDNMVNSTPQYFTVPDLWDNASHSIYFSWNQSSSFRNVSVDDGTFNTSTSAFTLPSALLPLHIGNRNDGLRQVGGIIRYFLVYPFELSTSQRTQMYNYNYVTTSNFTSDKNWTDGNVTYQVIVNATTPSNTNYSVLYRQNGTGAFTTLATAQTGNTTHAITTQYQNTDVRIVLNGNDTATPELIQIVYYTQVPPTYAPNITSYSNTKTNDETVNITVNSSESITFNVTANQTITTWNWYVNGTNQNMNYDNISLSYASEGTRLIQINATNSNGTTQTISWNLTVLNPSTEWTYGIGGQFFQNKTIGSNRTCINQGDGSIGIGYLCDNFNDNNTVGWNETGDLSGTWTAENGIVNQSTAVSSYQYWNISSYENMSIFTKFKEYGNLTSYIDASDLRGNLSRPNANPSWPNCQFSIGSPTFTRAHIYCYNGSSWLVVNNTATKTRYLNEWNYAGFFANGTYFRGYLSNVSYANAMINILSSGTSSQWLNGTTIQFGGQPNSAATISWDEIRAVELDAQGNQYLQGNYSMNYTVPASQYAKNITINGSYCSGCNYTLYYRQNGTGNYITVEGIKTADATIELPTPYYQNIDIQLEMNASISDTLWITNITVDVSATSGNDTTPPASITGLTNITGNFYHNWTWTNPADSDFNGTTIYINGTFITNVTNITASYNLTALAHNESTISTHTFDITGNSNSTWVNHTSIIPNNIPSLSADNQTVDEGQSVYIQSNSIDADSDTLIYSVNRTDLFTDFSTSTGKGNWTTNYSSSGTVYLDLGVTDGYGGQTNYTMQVTVTNVPLTITSYLPSSDPSTNSGAMQPFNITLNRTANTTWYYNTSLSQTNTTLTISNYTNTTLSEIAGTHNITLDATDGIDSTTQTWLWTVIASAVQTTTGGGGGGGTPVKQPDALTLSTNPPSVDIFGSGLNWEIKIMNEGTSEQEYIINWVLKTQSGAIVDSGVLSKKILPNETYTVPLTFMGLFPGNYAIKAVVQYGIYQSEANQFFSVGINYSMTETIILLSILTAIFLVSLYFRKPKK